MSHKASNPSPDEHTPLINGGPSGASNHQDHVNHHTQRSTAYALFIDAKHTPGQDSSNVVVKGLAHTWHIIKITILSSTSAPASCVNREPNRTLR
jgi:hypothetical protein